jgi:hypothetical protein
MLDVRTASGPLLLFSKLRVLGHSYIPCAVRGGRMCSWLETRNISQHPLSKQYVASPAMEERPSAAQPKAWHGFKPTCFSYAKTETFHLSLQM